VDSNDLPDRVAMLERLAAQQLTMNDRILELTALLTREQALHADRLARHDDLLARLTQTLEAIKDLLHRPNGH
jgi:hypothetical protein